MSLTLGVYVPAVLPYSLQNYTDYVTRELGALGVDCVRFSERDPLPSEADLFWDPRAAGGAPPCHRLRNVTRPLVVTVHGAAPMAMPANEYFSSFIGSMRGRLSNMRRKTGWKKFKGRYAAIIAVSEFGRKEIVAHLGVIPDRVTVIAHGLAHELFRPAEQKNGAEKRFFLHLSQYQPLKNIRRMLEAYERISSDTDIGLEIVAPGLPDMPLPLGVTVVREPVTQQRAAELYRAATAFLFPSLRESFGIPILEAMASGCPVITSRGSACEETAGGAALLVDPYSVEELAVAMARVASDAEQQAELARRGLERAAGFSWRKSAEEHLALFESVLRQEAEA